MLLMSNNTTNNRCVIVDCYGEMLKILVVKCESNIYV